MPIDDTNAPPPVTKRHRSPNQRRRISSLSFQNFPEPEKSERVINPADAGPRVAYSASTRRSSEGAIRGGEDERTSAPATVE